MLICIWTLIEIWLQSYCYTYSYVYVLLFSFLFFHKRLIYSLMNQFSHPFTTYDFHLYVRYIFGHVSTPIRCDVNVATYFAQSACNPKTPPSNMTTSFWDCKIGFGCSFWYLSSSVFHLRNLLSPTTLYKHASMQVALVVHVNIQHISHALASLEILKFFIQYPNYPCKNLKSCHVHWCSQHDVNMQITTTLLL